MSNRLFELSSRLLKLEQQLRLHPDPDVNVWADEIKELRLCLEKEWEGAPGASSQQGGTNNRKLLQGLALARLLWDLIAAIKNESRD